MDSGTYMPESLYLLHYLRKSGQKRSFFTEVICKNFRRGIIKLHPGGMYENGKI
jgi:hypothetical protein